MEGMSGVSGDLANQQIGGQSLEKIEGNLSQEDREAIASVNDDGEVTQEEQEMVDKILSEQGIEGASSEDIMALSNFCDQCLNEDAAAALDETTAA